MRVNTVCRPAGFDEAAATRIRIRPGGSSVISPRLTSLRVAIWKHADEIQIARDGETEADKSGAKVTDATDCYRAFSDLDRAPEPSRRIRDATPNQSDGVLPLHVASGRQIDVGPS